MFGPPQEMVSLTQIKAALARIEENQGKILAAIDGVTAGGGQAIADLRKDLTEEIGKQAEYTERLYYVAVDFCAKPRLKSRQHKKQSPKR